MVPLLLAVQAQDLPANLTLLVMKNRRCSFTAGTAILHVDRAFEEAAALLMSVESFKLNRKVRWDAAKETISS